MAAGRGVISPGSHRHESCCSRSKMRSWCATQPHSHHQSLPSLTAEEKVFVLCSGRAGAGAGSRPGLQRGPLGGGGRVQDRGASQAGARAVTRVGDTRRHGSQLDADASNVDCTLDRVVSPASFVGHSAVVDTWNAVTGPSPDYHRSEDYGPAWTWGTPTNNHTPTITYGHGHLVSSC